MCVCVDSARIESAEAVLVAHEGDAVPRRFVTDTRAEPWEVAMAMEAVVHVMRRRS